jgi:hypothetical protein
MPESPMSEVPPFLGRARFNLSKTRGATPSEILTCQRKISIPVLDLLSVPQFGRVKYPFFLMLTMRASEMLLAFILLEFSSVTLPFES